VGSAVVPNFYQARNILPWVTGPRDIMKCWTQTNT
jgi:hypothetical protein